MFNGEKWSCYEWVHSEKRERSQEMPNTRGDSIAVTEVVKISGNSLKKFSKLYNEGMMANVPRVVRQVTWKKDLAKRKGYSME